MHFPDADNGLGSASFEAQFVEDLRRVTEPIRLELDAGTALGLVGTLQLALRHPQFRGPTAQQMGQFVKDLIERLAVTDTIRTGLQAGADPRYDTPTPVMEGRPAPVRPTVVCLCGSTRFWRTFQAANLRETLAGRIVLSIAGATGTDHDHFANLPRAEHERVKTMLDELHLRKIDRADEVLILDESQPWCPSCQMYCLELGGSSRCCAQTVQHRPYIGESTGRELAYARAQGKRVRFWSKEGTAQFPGDRHGRS